MLLAHAGRPGPNDVVLPKYTDEQKFTNFEGKRWWLQLRPQWQFGVSKLLCYQNHFYVLEEVSKDK